MEQRRLKSSVEEKIFRVALAAANLRVQLRTQDSELPGS